MRIALLSGPCPPHQCGVGDYTRLLADALQARGIETLDFPGVIWGLGGVLEVQAALRKLRPDVVHMQYPTLGFGPKLGPQALALLTGCVITIHEASRSHLLRKIALLPFAVRPKHIIFTSEFEREFALNWVPWLSRLCSVIPIPSNVGVATQNRERTLNEIVYFGLIMPSKRVEEVLKLAALIKFAGLSLQIRIVGTPPDKYSAYAAGLRAGSANLPVIWECGLDEKQVAERLAQSSLAYLPYQDGASERRATLKAALANGLVVITTRGTQTPDILDDAVMYCKSPEEALTVAQSLLVNPDKMSRLACNARLYGQQFTWERTAELHSILYQKMAGAISACRQMRVGA